MPAGLIAALVMLAPTPVSGETPAAKPAPETCENQQTSKGDIVICAERQQGYRLNPDIMEAKRELKSGRLKPPESYRQNDCSTVGPAGCLGTPTLDFIGMALTAVEMAQKAAKGENPAEVFVTDPHPDEYHLYLQAKRQREAREAKEKADALAAQVKADVAREKAEAKQNGSAAE